MGRLFGRARSEAKKEGMKMKKQEETHQWRGFLRWLKILRCCSVSPGVLVALQFRSFSKNIFLPRTRKGCLLEFVKAV